MLEVLLVNIFCTFAALCVLQAAHTGGAPVPNVSGDSFHDLEKSQEEKTRAGTLGLPAQSSATMHQLTSRHAPLLLLVVMGTVTSVTRAQGAEQCRALSGERCTFPFTFNNTEYSACTGAGHPIGRPRCFIKVMRP